MTPNPTPASAAGPQETAESIYGAQILPDGGREQLVRLSYWNGFTVVDQNEQVIGSVQDYIINMCEAHILYLLVDTDQGNVLIPFEAVTLNGGILNAESKNITLALNANELSAVPTIDPRPDLGGLNWESEVRNYWGGLVNLSSLDTSCAVSTSGSNEPVDNHGATQGVDVFKLAYAGSISGAALRDGNQTSLGTIQDALVEPESGQIFFLVVRLEVGRMILLPIGAVNVPKNAGETAADEPFNLVFLLDNGLLDDAPSIDSLDILRNNVNEAAYEYWNQYAPMGPGGS